MLRAARNSPASTSSLTALALAPGALKTGMPRWLSFATGMLLVPAPARATASTLAGISIACTSAERTSNRIGPHQFGRDFVAIARQALEPAQRDVVESLDLEHGVRG